MQSVRAVMHGSQRRESRSPSWSIRRHGFRYIQNSRTVEGEPAMSKQLFRIDPKGISVILIGLIAMLLVSTPALAQTGSAVIRGVVRDANQAVVPGASVTITNERTGVEQKTQTNAEGIYYFGAVPIGPYVL